MTTTTWAVLLVVALIGLAYKKANLKISAAVIAAITLVALFSDAATGFVVSAALFAIAFGVLSLSTFRANTITRPIFAIYKKILPEMSETESTALEAGTVWWDGELFAGKPNWQKLLDHPNPQLRPDEQAFLDNEVETLCSMINEYDIKETGDMPVELWDFIKANRFFSMIIPKEYGGLEFSAQAQSAVLQKLSGLSSTVLSTVGVPNSLGPGELLLKYGTDEQKNHYLPRLAEGKEIPCFALTSPEAGSDAGSIPDYGIVCKGEWQGEEVLGMRLTWNKRYITLAPVATVLGLAFKLRDPDGLLGDTQDLGITCALIPTDLPGVEIGNRHFPLNVPFQNGPTQAQDLFVPMDFIIGGQKMAGQGWRMLVECLSVGRGITLPSNSTGGLKTAALATGAYARIRRQFKQPIGRMEGVEEPLARLAGNAYVMDAASNLTVAGIDLGEKPSVISAIVKYHCTHRGQRSIIDAMDIVGGKGICLGPSNFLARGYQGSPIAITVEGANILTRSMIIYGQGAIRCHPYVLEEMNAAYSESSDALDKFDSALAGHVSFTMSNLVRSLWFGLTDGRGSSTPVDKETKRYYQQLNRYSANLALLSDISMAVLGGSLKRRERLSARLGDILSQLYLGSATLKRFESEGSNKEDLALVHWGMQDSLRQTEVAIDEFLANFPNPVVGRLLRVILLPFGRIRRAPSDKLDSQVAQIIQTPSATRSRLGRGQFLAPTEHNAVGKIERALEVILEAEPLFDKVCKETSQRRPFLRLDLVAEIGLDKGILTTEEAALLKSAEEHRLYTINVDDFAPEELAAKPQYPETSIDNVA